LAFNATGTGYAAGEDDGTSYDSVAHGVVDHFWMENGLHRWRIVYDDGYYEDYDIAEMMAFGIDKESGSITISPAASKMSTAVDQVDTNPNPWIAVKSKSSKKSDNGHAPLTTTSSDKVITDKQNTIGPDSNSCLCGCSSKVVLTVANEPFQELCMRMPGVETN
jgi:hypothetical protein